jgi:hypothetical protein
MSHIEELRGFIHHLDWAKAKHLESVPVRESVQGQTVWDGTVEVFRLKGHPKADKVYAWMHDTNDPANLKRHVTVLHLPPIVSPQIGVRAAIVQEFKNRA